MAAETKPKYDVPEDKLYQYKKDYQDDWYIHRNYVSNFDPLEAMLIGQVYDQVSNSIDGAKITDSYAATLAIERSARVMGKLPDGVVQSVAKADQGKAAFMDILRQKWIYPNANAQHRFETKLRLWQLYSTVYGYMPMFYDWNISATGYVGPDCWLWNPRNLVPQQGRTSIADMEYVTALTYVSKTYLEDKLENLTEGDGWDEDALKLLIGFADKEKSGPDPQKDTQVERTRIGVSTKRGVLLATRYEAGPDGTWCTFAPDHGYVQVREIENPHKNGRIPFVIKYAQPLYDSFYGLGDFQRAKPLQFARDGLTNFYFKGIKMNLIPPLVVNANGVLKHTIDYREGAVMMETIPQSIRRLETSNAGLATYQGAQSALTGSLLSLYGSQNASSPAQDTLNPSQGKTPAAIDLYQGKEADRDGQEMMFLEQAIEELTEGFFSLVANIGTEDIPVALFSDDIEDIVDAGLEDVLGLFTTDSVQKFTSKSEDGTASFSLNPTGTGGVLKVDPTKFQGTDFRFRIDPGSTAKASKAAQLQSLQEFVGIIGKLQNVLQNDPRVQVQWPTIMEAFENLTDISGVEKFIQINPDAKPQPEPQAPPQTSATAVQTPGGNVHEVADLVQLYKVADAGLQAQIVQALGFSPSAQPSTISTGHTFSDPSIAAAAQALATPPQGATPTTPQPATSAPEQELHPTGKGRVYTDKHVAQAVSAIESSK